jgi:trans-aconitate 2-methyltransferase
MERTREPELMDDPLQARAYAEADFASTDQAFTDRILAWLAAAEPAWLALAAPEAPEAPGAPPANGRILDLGCGPGNISFRLAAALPGAAVLGIDGAAAMLELAERQRQSQPALWPRLRFARACLPVPAGGLEGLPAAFAPPFALIVSNSLLHHLHDPAVLWRAVRQWAAPGALVAVRDLRRPPSPEARQTLVEHHANGAPPVLRRDYAASLAAAFRPEEVEAQLAAAGLGSLRVEPLDDRYLEVSGRLPA